MAKKPVMQVDISTNPLRVAAKPTAAASTGVRIQIRFIMGMGLCRILFAAIIKIIAIPIEVYKNVFGFMVCFPLIWLKCGLEYPAEWIHHGSDKPQYNFAKEYSEL